MKRWKVFVTLFVVIVISAFLTQADGNNYTDYIYSPASNANIPTGDGWHSLDYSSIYNGVCGGNVGMWYYATNTGLPGAFIRSNDRRCYVEMYEQNEGENTYDTVRRYTGYFVVPAISTDPYRTNSWSCTFTQPNIIETDGTVELGMYYYVTKITGDTGVFVPYGLFMYRYWAD